MAAVLVPIATVTVLVSLLLMAPGAGKGASMALQISATIAFHRALETGAVPALIAVKSESSE
jgi:hypothetical protein